MYELKKKIGKLFTSKFVGTEPSSFKKEFTGPRVSQKLRNTGLDNEPISFPPLLHNNKKYPRDNICYDLLISLFGKDIFQESKHNFRFCVELMFNNKCSNGIKGWKWLLL
jgi:hypothetical protein